MRIIPVLDVMRGQVVRGVAGQREHYRPIESILCRGSEPPIVAEAIRSEFAISELYLADLDAILGGAPSLGLYRRLAETGFDLMVDAGLSLAKDAFSLLEAGVNQLVVGLETIRSPGDLESMVAQLGPRRVIFSLDLKGGQALVGGDDWSDRRPEAIAAQAIDGGVEKVLILDLARVGVGEGFGTEELACRLRKNHPQIGLYVGGGVRGPADLSRVLELGVDGVLVASALHDGRLTASDLGRFQRPAPPVGPRAN